MSMRFIFYDKQMIPDKVVIGSDIYQIIEIDSKLYINGFVIVVEDSKIKSIFIGGYHPNSNPENCEYCLDASKIGLIIDDKLMERVEGNIRTYYFNNCFFKPKEDLLKYVKIPSITFRGV